MAEINLTPTEAMASNARRGLEMRRSANASERGGTAVGVQRARNIANRDTLSPRTVRAMNAFFARHGAQGAGSAGASTRQRIAWLLWGGSAGRRWARARAAELEAAGR